MSKESKPREWKTATIGIVYTDSYVAANGKPSDCYDLIERSAYDAVVAERDEWREQCEETFKTMKALEIELEERRVSTPTMNALYMMQAERDQALELLREAINRLEVVEQLSETWKHRDFDMKTEMANVAGHCDEVLTKIHESKLLGDSEHE